MTLQSSLSSWLRFRDFSRNVNCHKRSPINLTTYFLTPTCESKVKAFCIFQSKPQPPIPQELRNNLKMRHRRLTLRDPTQFTSLSKLMTFHQLVSTIMFPSLILAFSIKYATIFCPRLYTLKHKSNESKSMNHDMLI